MKDAQYKEFSLKIHKKNWQLSKPNICQFELTFKCGIYCRHCYSDCYNKPAFIKKELATDQVKRILDKVHSAGVIWLCFTGGDPITRQDFPEIYSYAKHKGFIISIFTSGYSMTKKIADFLAKMPPFVIEVTLNAHSADLCDKVTQVHGSFERIIKGINMILERKIPLKVKTMITKDNAAYKGRIKEFIEKLGLEFRPSILLYPRLNRDLTPCTLRVSTKEAVIMRGNVEELCEKNISNNGFLFRCALGTRDGFHIDPYGNVVFCNLIRDRYVSSLEEDIGTCFDKLYGNIRGVKYRTNSKCNGCHFRQVCCNCPGTALLETGDMESHIDYYCDLAQGLS